MPLQQQPVVRPPPPARPLLPAPGPGVQVPVGREEPPALLPETRGAAQVEANLIKLNMHANKFAKSCVSQS